jgi:hypothetical protein
MTYDRRLVISVALVLPVLALPHLSCRILWPLLFHDKSTEDLHAHTIETGESARLRK